MNRRLFLAGLGLCVLIPTHVLAEPLYDRIKEQVIRDLAHGDIDNEVNDFVRETFREKYYFGREQLQQVLNGDWQGACGSDEAGDPLKSRTACMDMASEVTYLAEHEQAIRAFGRTLQSTAASYELPLSAMPRNTYPILNDLRGILSIWTAGTGSLQDVKSSGVFTTVIDDETFKPLIKNIGDKLKELDPEQQTAAVWRYQNGVRLVRGERSPTYPEPYFPGDSGPGTERQFLSKRWDDLETELKALWSKILTHTFSRPLEKGETMHLTFPENFFSDLPDNITLWGRLNGEATGPHAESDVGLQWETPLETVQPSLLTEEDEEDRETILGGAYPPEPVTIDDEEITPLDGQSLCTHAFAFDGYLCRPFELISESDRCPPVEGEEAPPPDTISIVTCTKTGSLRFTSAGADVCREINWKPSKPFNPNTQCKLDIRCAQKCNPGGAAQTLLKDSTGTVKICVDENPQGPATYLLYHEMVHAYQNCNQPPVATEDADDHYKDMTDAQANQACCRWETEAYQAHCAMMERDGVFKNAPGFILPDGKVISLNAETCMEYFTNATCTGGEKNMKGCYTSRTYPEGFRQAILDQMENNNPAKVPDLCSQSTDSKMMDQRVKALKELIERRDDVCMPGQVNKYPNRIGNNMCFIGQCVEESVEMHRIAAGSVPVSVSGEVAPWDNPVSGTPLGNAVVNPPLSQGRFPSYRPQLLVRNMETALCQLVGLPPLQPPILCIIEASRQLQTLQTTPATTALGLVNQFAGEELSAKDILALTPAVASRAGTNLYAVYLRDATRSFSDILSMAGKLLDELEKISFPVEMCPIGPGLPPPISAAP